MALLVIFVNSFSLLLPSLVVVDLCVEVASFRDRFLLFFGPMVGNGSICSFTYTPILSFPTAEILNKSCSVFESTGCSLFRILIKSLFVVAVNNSKSFIKLIIRVFL